MPEMPDDKTVEPNARDERRDEDARPQPERVVHKPSPEGRDVPPVGAERDLNSPWMGGG